MKVKINENTIRKIVAESLKMYIKENEDFASHETTIKPEPRTVHEKDAFGDLELLCKRYKMKYVDMGDKETFAVVCRIDPETGQPFGDVEGFEKFIKRYIENGELEEIKSGILKIGVWYKQYKILVNLIP